MKATNDAPREGGRFIAGHTYGPATQFRAGQVARNKLPLGSVCIRREHKTGNPRAWIKVAEPNVWKKRAVLVWESLHGPVPCGSVVHHKDRDSTNDEPGNLTALTRREHADEHRGELTDARGPGEPQRIIAVLRASPGQTAREIATATGIGAGRVSQLLCALRKRGLIQSERTDAYRHFAKGAA